MRGRGSEGELEAEANGAWPSSSHRRPAAARCGGALGSGGPSASGFPSVRVRASWACSDPPTGVGARVLRPPRCCRRLRAAREPLLTIAHVSVHIVFVSIPLFGRSPVLLELISSFTGRLRILDNKAVNSRWLYSGARFTPRGLFQHDTGQQALCFGKCGRHEGPQTPTHRAQGPVGSLVLVAKQTRRPRATPYTVVFAWERTRCPVRSRRQTCAWRLGVCRAGGSGRGRRVPLLGDLRQVSEVPGSFHSSVKSRLISFSVRIQKDVHVHRHTFYWL